MTAADVSSDADVHAQPRNYLDLYGLSRPPFGEAAGGAGYILFGSHRRAFEALVDHIVNGHGVVVLEGEEGSGKSEILRSAAAVAGETKLQVIIVARPPNDRTTAVQIVSAMRGGHLPADASNDDAITQFLAAPRKALLLDDIDMMSADGVRFVLSLVQRIPDDQSGPAVVLNISPGQTDRSKSPELSQLVSLARNTIRLSRLGPAEVRQYVERSLWIAGGTTRRLIATDAMKMIIARSGGLPGMINRLMEAALTAGFARGDVMITAKTVAASVGPLAPRLRPSPSVTSSKMATVMPVVAVGLLTLGASTFLYEALTGRPDVAKSQPVAVTPTPPRPPPVASPVETLPAELLAALMKRGDQALGFGDIAAARLLYKRAAEAGNAQAATALGKTYDPNFVAPGQAPDVVLATAWYRMAVAAGDARAADLLKRLKGS